MAKAPTRIDLLELDIDLRLTDLWREAGDVAEWNLEVVAAFMRAAYGKGYCDALTEDEPGSLCHDTGTGSRRRREPPAPLASRCSSRATIPVVARKRNPARLVIALSVAAVLAVFLLYTSIAGGGTPSLAPSELAGKTGDVILVGKVVGPATRATPTAAASASSSRDIRAPRSDGPRLYKGSVPTSSSADRDVFVKGKLRNGVFVAMPDSLVTKCPSKYTPRRARSLPELGRAALVATLGLALYAVVAGALAAVARAGAGSPSRRRTR